MECIQDEANNVIIKKAGTAGFENSEPVIIQGHLDMVCEKQTILHITLTQIQLKYMRRMDF